MEMISTKIFWIIFFLAVYFIFMYYRLKSHNQQKISEYEMLVILSRILEKSEFDIFEESCDKWDILKDRLNSDFRIYLEKGTIPFYVRDYIRSHGEIFSPEVKDNKPESDKFRSL